MIMLIIKHHKDGRYFQIAAGIDSINVLDTIEEEEVCQMNNLKIQMVRYVISTLAFHRHKRWKI